MWRGCRGKEELPQERVRERDLHQAVVDEGVNYGEGSLYVHRQEKRVTVVDENDYELITFYRAHC